MATTYIHALRENAEFEQGDIDQRSDEEQEPLLGFDHESPGAQHQA